MSQSLPEQLRATLREQAGHAPRPEATVEGVLARTVAAVQSARPRHRWARPLGLREHRPAVAAVLVGVLAVAGLVTAVRLHPGDGPRSGPVAQLAPGSRASAGSQPAPAPGSAVGPNALVGPSDRAGRLLPNLAAPALDCSALPGSQVRVAAAAVLAIPGSDTPSYVYESHCQDGAGRLLPSELRSYTFLGGKLEPRAELLAPGDGRYVVGLNSSAGTLEVRAFDPAAGYLRLTYRTADGGRHYTSSTSTLAPACKGDRLQPSLVRRRSPAVTGGSYWLLRLTNTAGTSCALQGYPQLSAVGAVAPRLSLRGPAGGISTDTTPVVLVGPGQSVAAIVEPTGQPVPTGRPGAGCAASSALSVSLPGSSQRLALAGRLALCAVTVHPIAASPEGSQ